MHVPLLASLAHSVTLCSSLPQLGLAELLTGPSIPCTRRVIVVGSGHSASHHPANTHKLWKVFSSYSASHEYLPACVALHGFATYSSASYLAYSSEAVGGPVCDDSCNTCLALPVRQTHTNVLLPFHLRFVCFPGQWVMVVTCTQFKAEHFCWYLNPTAHATPCMLLLQGHMTPTTPMHPLHSPLRPGSTCCTWSEASCTSLAGCPSWWMRMHMPCISLSQLSCNCLTGKPLVVLHVTCTGAEFDSTCCAPEHNSEAVLKLVQLNADRKGQVQQHQYCLLMYKAFAFKPSILTRCMYNCMVCI